MKKILLTTIISGLLLSSSAFAASVNSNFNSSANLSSYCRISAQNMTFGELNVIETPTAFASGGFTVLCSKGVNYSITPTGGWEDSNIHLLKGTGNNKDAILIRFVKEDMTTYWKTITGGKIEGQGNGADNTHPVSARFLRNSPSGSFDATVTNASNFQARPDNYSLTVTATITY